MSVTATIAAALSVPERQVLSAVALIDGGATAGWASRNVDVRTVRDEEDCAAGALVPPPRV